MIKQRLMVILLLCLIISMATANAEEALPFTTSDVSVAVELNGIDSATMYKLARVELDAALVKSALDAYCVTPASDEAWELQINSRGNLDFALLYSDQSGHTGTISCDYAGPPSLYHHRDEALDHASETVRSFLESIGLMNFEYPFYYCDYEYKTFVGSAWHPVSEDDYLECGYASKEDQLKKWNRLGGPMIYVVVRFTIDDLPYGTSISWTENTNKAGNGNPTPSAFFGVAPDGKIAAIMIRNPVEVIDARESSETLLPWQNVLSMNASIITEQMKQNNGIGNTLTLRNVELVMMTNANNITFPAWHFVFEERMCDEYMQKCFSESLMNENLHYLTIGKYYDAMTGKAVLQ